jgi:hypothetical protein
LILGAGGDTLVQSEMLKELADFIFPHLDWMTFAMKKDKLSSPERICLLGPQ